MKRIVFMLILSVMLVIPVLAAGEGSADLEKEKSAIKQAALDYMEGWYEGNAERMERALHPELSKRSARVLPHTGKLVFDGVGAATMVEYTRAGLGKRQAAAKGNVTVKVLDVSRKIASAKVTSAHYNDYLLLVKADGAWRIFNVLWEPAEPPIPPPPPEKK